MRITILGSGGSTGVPGAAGVGWGRCDPSQPRNRRLRPSILVEQDNRLILIDTSPDLRAQLLAAGVHRLDAVLYTHAHADHLHGIDDLRPVNRAMGAPLDIYADPETLATIRQRFGYVFDPLPDGVDFYYKPVLLPHELTDRQGFAVGGLSILPLVQDHGYGTSLGFRFGREAAYTTDVVRLSDEDLEALAGVKLWVVGALGDQAHPTHAHVERVLEWIERVRPRRAVLTHMGVGLDYDSLRRKLPIGVEPGYDGMVIEVGAAE